MSPPPCSSSCRWRRHCNRRGPPPAARGWRRGSVPTCAPRPAEAVSQLQRRSTAGQRVKRGCRRTHPADLQQHELALHVLAAPLDWRHHPALLATAAVSGDRTDPVVAAAGRGSGKEACRRMAQWKSGLGGGQPLKCGALAAAGLRAPAPAPHSPRFLHAPRPLSFRVKTPGARAPLTPAGSGERQ